MISFLAQKIKIGEQEIEGPLNLGIGKSASDYTVGDIVGKLTDFLIPFGAVIFFLALVWGGYDYLLSRGDPEKMKSAKGKLTTGAIGFILLISSYLIVKLIAAIFGLGGGML